MQISTLGLLIVNYYHHELILRGRIKVQDGLYLIKPKLSWILSGGLFCRNSETVMENVMFIVTQILALLPLEVHHLAHESTAGIFESKDLWNLDMIGIKKPNKLENLITS